MIVIFAIIGIVFFSFTSEIQKNTIEERQKQLDVIEDTISKRMEEVSSIAYHISTDEAFILMLISAEEIEPILKTQLLNCYGEVKIFSVSGELICQTGNLQEEIPFYAPEKAGKDYFSFHGRKYIRQQKISESNGWTYVSVIRLNDVISEVVHKQMIFIVLLMGLMILAIFLC